MGAGRAPSPDIRDVVRGKVRAEKGFAVYTTERKAADKIVLELEQESAKTLRELQAERRRP